MSKVTLQNGVSGLTFRTALNSMFTELYNANAAAQTVDSLGAANTLGGSEAIYGIQTQSSVATDVKITPIQLAAYNTTDAVFTEWLEDHIAAMTVAGSGLSKTYSDVDGTVTLSVSSVPTVINAPSLAESADYTVATDKVGYAIGVTTGGTDKTIVLPVTGISDGSILILRKEDTGVGKVIITDGGTARAWLMTQRDTVMVRWNGTNWQVVTKRFAPYVYVYTAAGTTSLDLPPLAERLDFLMCGGGSGGGSGRRGAAASARFGGGGGSPGNWNLGSLRVSLLTSPLSVVVGAGGTGGAAVTADSTSGNVGSTGGDTSLSNGATTYAIAKGNTGGSGGTASAGTGAGVTTNLTLRPVGSGGASSTTGSAASGQSGTAGSGGGGGGIDASDVIRSGGSGGQGSLAAPTATSGGTAGTSGATGGNGGTPSNTDFQSGGSGGGGGGSSITTTAGSGGNGSRGGGGGGGGASVNGQTSGAGGNGGDGFIHLTVWF